MNCSNKPPIFNSCEKCTNTLLNHGYICYDITRQVFENNFNSIPCIYNEDEKKGIQEILRFLEKKNFLVSTEISHNEIAFKPTRCKSFCWCSGKS